MTRYGIPLLVAVLAASVVTNGHSPAGAERAPDRIAPPPREVQARADGFVLTPLVGLVRAAGTDPHAEDLVRQVLRSAGVKHIRTTDGADPRTPVTVWLGDWTALLGVDGASGLPAEGYVLAAGRARHRSHIVLDGVDADGTYYAAQSLRQLIRGARVPGIEVRDWPTMHYRGSIEGFYGTPWSLDDRLDHLDYLGAHKMNTYEYAPKDDPFHRERWREPYPADKLAELGTLVTRAARNHVDFTFAVSPGLSICYSSPDDLAALLAKFESIYALGGRSFNVALDDIDAGRWNCAADLERYGPPGAGAAGLAQSELLNAVQAWVRDKGDIKRLQMVPTEYYNATESPYKKSIRETLDQQVIVHWTGLGVIPAAIMRADAARARAVFGHEILVWDNYPVNDYIAGRLPLAAYTGREPGLSNELVGIISNPMNQAAASKIALYSFADFGWHDTVYDADASWRRALAEQAGGDRKVVAALADFADLSTYDGTLHGARSPKLAAEIATFWPAWQAGSPTSLRRVVSRLHAAPGVLRDGVPAAFTEQADAWLTAAEVWTRAMLAALDVLDAVRAGDGAAGLRARDRAVALMTQAREIRDIREPHSRTYPKIADGVLDTFIADAFREYDRWLGLPPRPAAATTLGTYQDNTADRMVDGKLDTFYWSDGPPAAGAAITVDLGAVTSISDIAVLMGKTSSPNDFMPAGVLEHSADGSAWTALTEGTTAEVRATAPDGTTARYVRYRATTGSGFWLVVREFSVSSPDDPVWTVTATPAGTDWGSTAADRSLDTAWTAGSAPAAGDALVATLDKPRAVTELTVIGAGSARVAVRVDGQWRDVGTFTGPYTKLPAGGAVDAVRLEWAAGSAAPRIAEIAPRFG